jgi:hypothetical protein
MESEIPCVVYTSVMTSIHLAHGLCPVKGTALAVPTLIVRERLQPLRYSSKRSFGLAEEKG